MSTTPLNALRVFEAVARLGSFRAAADHLCVTQSAVSHQVRHLEDWLGAPLFERQGNRTQLLPHALELSGSLSSSLAEIDAACHRASVSRAQMPLVIAAIPSVAMCWLIPRLMKFKELHPTVATRMIYAMHGQDIDFRETHVAFVFSATPPEIAGVEVMPFLPGTSVPVCSPDLLQKSGRRKLKPAEIRKFGLLHDRDETGWRSWLENKGIRETTALGGPVFEDFNLLRGAALSGQGVALCATVMIRSDLESGQLVQVSDTALLDDHDYYLLIGPQARANMIDEVLAFRDWALAERDIQLQSL
ncbi:LysR substrate-binding domain-containing protein [Aliiroseovarius sp. S1339]|uniref:LysR family transcriptional regulator n=1 Tax=Aliiroseovarius sp. S1339 TaxID=2936990 RepID=UPI0020BE3658|nr:LysR family transcriptional regulator [Aliiroseovarius sp. S1339]MCK8464026.1 LysR substrate-binding domain-containing protein [Aliiroseovarius sp. S1339]